MSNGGRLANDTQYSGEQYEGYRPLAPGHGGKRLEKSKAANSNNIIDAECCVRQGVQKLREDRGRDEFETNQNLPLAVFSPRFSIMLFYL